MGHGLKDIAFYVQNHITPCAVVITSVLVHDKPRGAPESMKRVYCIRSFLWQVMTQPCPNFNGGLAKPPWKLGHG